MHSSLTTLRLKLDKGYFSRVSFYPLLPPGCNIQAILSLALLTTLHIDGPLCGHGMNEDDTNFPTWLGDKEARQLLAVLQGMPQLTDRPRVAAPGPPHFL